MGWIARGGVRNVPDPIQPDSDKKRKRGKWNNEIQLMKIINERLSYYQRKLEIIETAMNTEMQKERRARNYGLLNFLAKERDVFRYVSSEVRLIVESMDQPSGNN